LAYRAQTIRLGQAASASRFDIGECRAQRNIKTIEREERVCDRYANMLN